VPAIKTGMWGGGDKRWKWVVYLPTFSYDQIETVFLSQVGLVAPSPPLSNGLYRTYPSNLTTPCNLFQSLVVVSFYLVRSVPKNLSPWIFPHRHSFNYFSIGFPHCRGQTILTFCFRWMRGLNKYIYIYILVQNIFLSEILSLSTFHNRIRQNRRRRVTCIQDYFWFHWQ